MLPQHLNGAAERVILQPFRESPVRGPFRSGWSSTADVTGTAGGGASGGDLLPVIFPSRSSVFPPQQG
jgi:hypothetical protein